MITIQAIMPSHTTHYAYYILPRPSHFEREAIKLYKPLKLIKINLQRSKTDILCHNKVLGHHRFLVRCLCAVWK